MLGRLKFEIDALAEEILNNIPEDMFTSNSTTFLDPAMGGGQFLKAVISRLRKYGHSDENISLRIFGYETNIMRVKFASKKCENIGTFEVLDFLGEDMSKKFDVIVANPPYNDEHNSGNALWSQFIMKTDSMLVEDGYSAYIVPGRWVLPGVNINKNKVRIWDEIISKKNTIVINHGECSDHFQNVGSDADYFSYFVYANKENTGSTVLINRKGCFTIDTSKLNWLPYKNANDLSISIVSKINSKTTEVFNLAWKYEQRKKTLEDSGEYPIFTGRDNNLNPIIKYSDEQCSMQSLPKIIFKLGRFLNYDRRLYIDYKGEVGFNSAYVISIKENENYDYLYSKLYRFLGQCLFNGSEITADGYRALPKLDPSKEWSDTELYKHFGLTQEEIEYIEANN
jgi:hypothetical protein